MGTQLSTNAQEREVPNSDVEIPTINENSIEVQSPERNLSNQTIVNINSNNSIDRPALNPNRNQNTSNSNRNLYFGPQIFNNGRNFRLGALPRGNDDHWLFGESSRDSALSSEPRFLTPQVHQTLTIRCPVNLNKNTLQLVPVVENNSRKYRLHFVFDATDGGTASIYYCAKETRNQLGEPIYTSIHEHQSQKFERGLGQSYMQTPTEYLDTSQFKEEELTYNAEQNCYPVVVVLECSGTDPKSRPISQTTFAALIHCADDSWVIKPVKQKIRFEDKSYVIHEIFGLESGETDIGKDCVICMTEPRDTTVLPCRHMCLCSACAEALRHQSNKCPICRSTVRSMVEIKIRSANEDREDINSDAEEEVLLKKKGKSEVSHT